MEKWGWMYNIGEANRWINVPHYSTDGNAMLELDREMRERGWEVTVFYEWNGKFSAEYETRRPEANLVRAEAETEPLARALAAYKALTGEEYAE